MSDAAKWYVVHTYSGYENKVASSIEKAVENRKLHDLITAVNIPVERVTEVKDGKTREIERKLFPGYVLVKMILTDESWYLVRNTRGCTGFVGPNSNKPLPLSDEEVAENGRGEARNRNQLSRWATACASSTARWQASSALSMSSSPKRTRYALSYQCSAERRPVELELDQVETLGD